MADEGFGVPNDAFVEILLRLPTSARRRFRLVCKRWRDVIDERTLERQVRTKILAFISERTTSRAIVLDDDKDGRCTHEWTYDSSTGDSFVRMIGTCNGLICLLETCNGDSSIITVANPVTGEAAILPPLPVLDSSMFGHFVFGYHPMTGQYKVVHVPSPHAQRRDLVYVLTLGGGSPAAWREIALPGIAVCHNPFCSMVSVDGSTYWLTMLSDRVVALDLADERVTSFQSPLFAKGGEQALLLLKLTNVHARLGVAILRDEPLAKTIEVWVLDGGGSGKRRVCGTGSFWRHT
ncbi:unnamed protein product [Urochloa humidicola]